MIKIYLEIALISLLMVSSHASAWGPQGHRISARIAEELLSETAKTAINDLLAGQSFAEAAFWADEMRSNPADFWQNQAGAYHYVTVPKGKTYREVGAPAQGDGVTALSGFRRDLRDKAASRAHKQLALRFSLHIIQDLHQPLHVGNGTDRGGTRYRVQFLGKNTNLHRVWDTDLILQAGLREGEWVSRLQARLTPEVLAQPCSDSPEPWIAESATLRDAIYPPSNRIDADYVRRQLPEIEERLLQSAIRVACYFNKLYEK